MRQTVLYIKVYKNKIVIKNIPNGIYVEINDCIFSTNKYLLGEISMAIEALRYKRKEILKGNILNYFFAPIILIQPMDLTENILAEVENMLLLELVYGARLSSNVKVWNGNELTGINTMGTYPLALLNIRNNPLGASLAGIADRLPC